MPERLALALDACPSLAGTRAVRQQRVPPRRAPCIDLPPTCSQDVPERPTGGVTAHRSRPSGTRALMSLSSATTWIVPSSRWMWTPSPIGDEYEAPCSMYAARAASVASWSRAAANWWTAAAKSRWAAATSQLARARHLILMGVPGAGLPCCGSLLGVLQCFEVALGGMTV